MSWSYKLRKSIRESLGVVANKTKLGLPLPASIGPMISMCSPGSVVIVGVYQPSVIDVVPPCTHFRRAIRTF